MPIRVKALFAFSFNSSRFFSSTNILVSSANNLSSILFASVLISLIYSRYNRGPKSDPCGIPNFIIDSLERVLLQIVLTFLFER